MVAESPVGSLAGLPGFLRIAFHHRERLDHEIASYFSISLQNPRPVTIRRQPEAHGSPDLGYGLLYTHVFRHFGWETISS